MQENADANTVTASFDLPGVTPEQVNIDVDQDRLTISGEASTAQQTDERGYTVRERSWGRFSRTLVLPQGTKVSARETCRDCFEPLLTAWFSTTMSRPRWSTVC